MTTPDAEVARWQRSLLPGGLVAGADARRSPARLGDRRRCSRSPRRCSAVVLIAIQHYDDARWVLDIALGLASIAALWWRRRLPGRGRARARTIVSIVSAFAGGAALIALFSATLRASRTGLIVVVVARARRRVPRTRSCSPPATAISLELLLGLLVTVVVVGWGLFARARRELVLSLRERAERGWRPSSACTSSRRARPSGAGSRARCTTCSPTASRC